MLLPSFVHVPGSMKGAQANYIMPKLIKISVGNVLDTQAPQPTPQRQTAQSTAQHTIRRQRHPPTGRTALPTITLSGLESPPKMLQPHPCAQLWNPSHSSPEAPRHPRAKQTPQMTILRGINLFLSHTNSLFLTTD